MKEVKGNLKEIFNQYNVICLPCSTYLKTNGEGVISKGFSEELESIVPELAKNLGKTMSKGSIVDVIGVIGNIFIVSFPIRATWYGGIDLEMLESSCKQLMNRTSRAYKILMPRLIKDESSWEDIKDVLEKHLDERITILS